MSKQAEITIDLASHLAHIMSVTYDKPVLCLSELFQNASRAGATQVDCRLTESPLALSITDDGPGCADPAVLLRLARSGWGASVASQKPYGEGFFSTLALCEHVRARSRDWQLTLDARRIAAGDLGAEVEAAEQVSGFTVDLTDIRPGTSYADLARELRDLARYAPFACTLNGADLPRVDFHALPAGAEWYERISAKQTSGYLQACQYGTLEIYSDGRRVTHAQSYLHAWVGMSGRLEVVPGALDLKRPDRQAIIDNATSREWRAAMLAAVRKLYLRVARDGSDGDIDAYGEPIAEYVDVEELSRLITVPVLDGQKLADFEQSIKQARVNGQDLTEAITEELDKPTACTGGTLTAGGGSTVSNRPVKRTKTGQRVATLAGRRVFWVKVSEVSELQVAIARARYYECSVAIARNRAAENVLRHAGISHLSNIDGAIRRNHNLQDRGPASKVEEQALAACRAAGKVLGYDHVAWDIGNLVSTEDLLAPDGRVLTSKRMPTLALALPYAGEIWLSRLHLKHDIASKGGRAGLHAMRFLLRHAETICHELAHQDGYDDGTAEHAQATVRLMSRLLEYIAEVIQ